MWPILLDLTEEESLQSLRHLELEAYSSLVSALRAQGSLNPDKRRILKESSVLLNISTERHKAEIRRAISDERLNTIAYHISGQLNSLEDWAQEGRRLVPLLPRALPQTSYSEVADEASEAAFQSNKQLPLPAHTERKRPQPQSTSPAPVLNETNGKTSSFRMPELPRDEPKRRKCNSMGEGSSLAQHLLGPKLTKIQQIYRQVSKVPKVKAREFSPEIENKDLIKSRPNGIPIQSMTPPAFPPSKVNIIQNIAIPSAKTDFVSVRDAPKETAISPLPHNDIPTKNLPLNPVVLLNIQQSMNTVCNNTNEELVSDTNKKSTPKKTISIGQKVIVVSNSQTLPTNSILQKTLSVPMNKLQKLNLDKFKIVPNPHTQISTTAPLQLSSPNLIASKPKLVTIKGTSNKKVIPLSKLQMFNPKANLKVIPYDGTLNNISSIPPENGMDSPKDSPLNVVSEPKCKVEVVKIEPLNIGLNGYVENGAEKASDEFDSNVDDFRIAQDYCEELDLGSSETLSSENSETDERNSNGGSSTESIDLENSDFMEPHHDGEVLQEFEVIHTDEFSQ
ncbi:BRCA2-interacting transcriptional repressor EMSY [Euwallacea fornicatus]|uniref:BRCA2-interacting transcriptional repressor EMSY n=1 Tax=Euwallacea fornicatus TaxID=995702 RepID=UPI00338FEF29